MDFFHSLPIPEFREWLFFIPFPFPNFGNVFFSFLSVPELWEWIFFIPFRFPNLLFHRRGSKRELDYYERYQFYSFLFISLTEKTGQFARICCKKFCRKGVSNSDKDHFVLIFFINSCRYNDNKRGDFQEWRRMGKIVGQKLFLTPHIF